MEDERTDARDETAESVSRDHIFGRERGQGTGNNKYILYHIYICAQLATNRIGNHIPG